MSKASSEDAIQAFYLTPEWKRLSYEAKKDHGWACQCCGATKENKVRITSDHIKPLRTHWHLRLDPENIQVLCDDCNLGKGSWDSTDHRPPSRDAILRQISFLQRATRTDANRSALKMAITNAYSVDAVSQEDAVSFIANLGLADA